MLLQRADGWAAMLGGKAPVIAFDDCDIDDLVENMALWGYYNAGQDCTAACRLYVQDAIYQEVVEKLTAAVKGIDVNEIGPLISEQQRETVNGFVERAKNVPHLKIAAGGARSGTPWATCRSPTGRPA